MAHVGSLRLSNYAESLTLLMSSLSFECQIYMFVYMKLIPIKREMCNEVAGYSFHSYIIIIYVCWLIECSSKFWLVSRTNAFINLIILPSLVVCPLCVLHGCNTLHLSSNHYLQAYFRRDSVSFSHQSWASGLCAYGYIFWHTFSLETNPVVRSMKSIYRHLVCKYKWRFSMY